MKPKNHGKPWVKAHLVRLKNLVDSGVSARRAAEIIGRSEIGAGIKLRVMNTIDMIENGSDEDTLVTWRKKKH